jgi:hypothetical protein
MAKTNSSHFLSAAAPLLCALAVLLPAAVQAQGSMEQRYASLMKRFGDEPGIRTVQEDAIRYASAEPERAASWFTRSAWANIAPRRVRAQLDRDYKDNRSATSKDRAEISARTDLDDDSLWQFTAEWDLSRLVYNPDMVKAASQAMDLAELREDVLNAVTKIFFERRSLRVELELSPPADFSDFATKRLRVDELTADLDALTGGAFTQRMRSMKASRARATSVKK